MFYLFLILIAVALGLAFGWPWALIPLLLGVLGTIVAAGIDA